jgi:iron-sulfur cluster assembly protein
MSADATLQPVSITPAAAREVKSIMESKNIPDGYGLRVGVRGGKGCFGVDYYVGFDQASDQDLTYEIDGIPILIKKAEMLFLVGVEMDFYEGADARGFHFNKES